MGALRLVEEENFRKLAKVNKRLNKPSLGTASSNDIEREHSVTAYVRNPNVKSVKSIN